LRGKGPGTVCFPGDGTAAKIRKRLVGPFMAAIGSGSLLLSIEMLHPDSIPEENSPH